MSTSVMSLPFTDRSGGMPSATSSAPKSPVIAPMAPLPTTATIVLPASSLRNTSGDRPRLLGMPGSGLRISFAADTTFVEGKLRSRGGSRRNAASLNLRPMEAGEKPPAVRIKLPKATKAMGVRQVSTLTSPLHQDLMHPRRALDIARSYGVPKYFLRGNSQVLTDGRMRLFADNVWKKERTSPPHDTEHVGGGGGNGGGGGGGSRRSIDNSDVICRLMDSVDKAIAISERPQQELFASDQGGGSAGGGTAADRERSALRESLVSLPDVLTRVSVKDLREGSSSSTAQKGGGGLNVEKLSTSAVANAEVGLTGDNHITSNAEGIIAAGQVAGSKRGLTQTNADRPHTVDSSLLPGQLPKVITKDGHVISTGILETDECNQVGSRDIATSHGAGISNHQNDEVPDTFSSANKSSGSANINNRVGVLFGGKYRNILPRFYPAVSAHHVRQREAAARLGGVPVGGSGVRLSTTVAGGKKRLLLAELSSGSPHPQSRRLVRFADTTQTVRFSKDTAVTTSSAGFMAVRSSQHLVPSPREQNNKLASADFMVTSRAPVQSIQRSLDSHSGLTRPEWFKSRGGRGMVPHGQRSLNPVVPNVTSAQKKIFKAAPDIAPITSPAVTSPRPLTRDMPSVMSAKGDKLTTSPRDKMTQVDPEVPLFDLEASIVVKN